MGSSYTRWHNSGEKVTGVFARQAIPMIWDFSEGSTFSNSTGNWMAHIEWIAKVVARLTNDVNSGKVYQADASTTIHAQNGPVIVTDPPTMTTSATLNFPTSSMFGCAHCYEIYILTCSQVFWCPYRRR